MFNKVCIVEPWKIKCKNVIALSVSNAILIFWNFQSETNHQVLNSPARRNLGNLFSECTFFLPELILTSCFWWLIFFRCRELCTTHLKLGHGCMGDNYKCSLLKNKYFTPYPSVTLLGYLLERSQSVINMQVCHCEQTSIQNLLFYGVVWSNSLWIVLQNYFFILTKEKSQDHSLLPPGSSTALLMLHGLLYLL